MSNEIYSTEQIQKKLLPIFRYYDVKRAILFGSYGKGIATQRSDIDILVDSQLKGLSFVGLVEDVRIAMDKEIDMFDVSHIEANSKIDEEIRLTGVLIYEK